MHKPISFLSVLSIALAIGGAAIAQQGSGQRPDRSAPQVAQTAPPPGVPGAQRGWSCSSCGFGAGYCVLNIVRYEYVCAPFRSYACAGFSGTSYCAFGTMCWDGSCQNFNLGR